MILTQLTSFKAHSSQKVSFLKRNNETSWRTVSQHWLCHLPLGIMIILFNFEIKVKSL